MHVLGCRCEKQMQDATHYLSEAELQINGCFSKSGKSCLESGKPTPNKSNNFKIVCACKITKNRCKNPP